MGLLSKEEMSGMINDKEGIESRHNNDTQVVSLAWMEGRGEQ